MKKLLLLISLLFALNLDATTTSISDTILTESSTEVARTEDTERYASRIFYKITKDNIFHGYLLGSVHHTNSEIQEILLQHLLPWLKTCKTIFGEIDSLFKQETNINTETSTTNSRRTYAGTEDIINELIKTHSLILTPHGFNKNSFNLSIAIPSPWFLHNYHATLKSPESILLLKLLFSPIYTPIMILKFMRKIIFDKLTKKPSIFTEIYNQLSKIMSDYKNQTTTFINDYSFAFLYERNKAWIEIIKQQPLNTPTLYVVGAGHLPGPYGLIDLLQQNGYQCQPISVTSSPENPLVLDDLHKPITTEQRVLYDTTRRTYMKSLLEDGKDAHLVTIYRVLYNLYKKQNENDTEQKAKILSDPWVYGPLIVSALSYFIEFAATQQNT